MDGPVEGTPYAWALLATARRNIRRIADEMPGARAKVDAYLPTDREKAKSWYDELTHMHNKLLEALSACGRCLLEMELDQEAAVTMRLHQAIRGFALMTPDYSKFAAMLGEYLSRLPEEDAGGKVSAAIIGRLMNRVRMGYYPTDPGHIDHMIRGIAFPEGVVTNLLDPCCGCGLALRRLAMGNNCMTYGVELDEERAQEAQENLHRVGVGSFFYSQISHEAFHVLFLNPPYLDVLKEGGKSTRSEKLFLVDAMKHLALEGLLIYILPFYRITADIARVLCDNFSQLSVYRFMGEEFGRFRQVAVFGLRQKRMDGSDLVDAFLDRVASAEIIPELSQLPENCYPLPPRELPVQVFKGAVFNELELQRQLKASGSIDRLLEKSALDSREKRPLLPLNVGQIGLIAGSGMINGLAECESPHVIKGRIVKEVTRSYDAADISRATTMTETYTNRMIFNVLTPNGFKSLT